MTAAEVCQWHLLEHYCKHPQIKAGFHMIADDRESQIVDRRKFCDRLRSYGNPLLRSFAIVCDPAIVIVDDRRR